jgi:hypothetical protein
MRARRESAQHASTTAIDRAQPRRPRDSDRSSECKSQISPERLATPDVPPVTFGKDAVALAVQMRAPSTEKPFTTAFVAATAEVCFNGGDTRVREDWIAARGRRFDQYGTPR